MITPSQIRAARGMLKWSAQELADKAGIALQTVQRMERDGGVDKATGKNVRLVQEILEGAGIIFIFEKSYVAVGLDINSAGNNE